MNKTYTFHDYNPNVIADVISYYEANYGEVISDIQVNFMAPEVVLDAYLKWNGIIGYTSTCIHILLRHDKEEWEL